MPPKSISCRPPPRTICRVKALDGKRQALRAAAPAKTTFKASGQPSIYALNLHRTARIDLKLFLHLRKKLSIGIVEAVVHHPSSTQDNAVISIFRLRVQSAFQERELFLK